MKCRSTFEFDVGFEDGHTEEPQSRPEQWLRKLAESGLKQAVADRRSFCGPGRALTMARAGQQILLV